MGYSKLPAMLIAVVALLMVMTTSRVAEGQTPSCAAKLVPCVDFLNTTGTPPTSCCDPLKEAVTQEMDCLCNLYNTPGFLASIGINVTQALLLPGRCNISSSSCANASAPSSPSSEPPPASSGNGVGNIAWSGIPSMLLVWASMMLF